MHGDKYDYSKVDYRGCKSSIKIICPIHGEFEQIATSHLSGRGCRICGFRNKDTNYFIQEAKKVHGDKYDYSKVDYKESKQEVIIICPEHGEFK